MDLTEYGHECSIFSVSVGHGLRPTGFGGFVLEIQEMISVIYLIIAIIAAIGVLALFTAVEEFPEIDSVGEEYPEIDEHEEITR